ncbi:MULTISPECIES: hypothetical protein [Halorussus]|uniref:hypothetical protein n=1 Tax=Halorussus TaxID=1070314 RepID=UPI00209EAF51|nr:hypothetical protein [Halorussus vallis]USZ74651.1 hypothetical protein NGM07_14545 [Halorussus vallis]
MVNIIQNFVDMATYITDAALSFPSSFILVLSGFLLITFSVLVFGYLTLGAIVDLFIPDSLGRRPPQQG